MKKLLCLTLALLLLLVGCDVPDDGGESIIPDTPEEEKYVPNTSYFGVAFASNESADPYTTPNKLNAELLGLICEPLFEVSDTFAVSPVLCADYSYENREYTITIKDGVTFSDGSELTAADVEYSLNAAREASSYYATRLSGIESVRASNKNGHLKIKLRYDNARFISLLDFPIIKKGTRGDMLPRGTGLYAPKDDFTALVARANHHSGKTVKYDALALCDVSSTDELVFKFDTHDVTLLTSDPTGTTQITPTGTAARTNVPTTQLHYLGFNARRAPLSDKNVRRAIARAIDRESAATGDFALMGNAAALPFHPKSALYNAELAAALSYDGATPLPTTEELTLLVNSENSGKLAVCKRIAETLTRLGAPTAVRAVSFDEYTRALARGDFDLYYAEVALGADFDITRLISGSLNYGGFSDASMTAAASAYLGGDEGYNDYISAFCDTVPFAPILFKDTAMYTEENFFKAVFPSAQNIYYNFANWEIGG